MNPAGSGALQHWVALHLPAERVIPVLVTSTQRTCLDMESQPKPVRRVVQRADPIDTTARAQVGLDRIAPVNPHHQASLRVLGRPRRFETWPVGVVDADALTPPRPVGERIDLDTVIVRQGVAFLERSVPMRDGPDRNFPLQNPDPANPVRAPEFRKSIREGLRQLSLLFFRTSENVTQTGSKPPVPHTGRRPACDVVRSQLRDRFPKHEVVPVLVDETVGRFLEKLALWARVGPVADDQPFDPASQRSRDRYCVSTRWRAT